jgi:hypothetical protein
MDIRVDVFNSEQYNGRDWPSENAIDFIGWFNEKISLIPEEFRDSATIDISSPYEYVSIEIYYKRPETKEDIKNRELNDLEMAEIERQMDMKKLEELNRKYEK